MEKTPYERNDTLKDIKNNVAITIIMPCLNEAETLERCIIKAHQGLSKANIIGEVLIADNGSTDGSIEIAERCGARVVHVREKGYGYALRGGIEAATSPWVLIGDSDDSYDFSNISAFVEKLKEGNDLVSGCRLPAGGGKILSGAMPWKNRWIGNPGLSWLGRLLFKTIIQDFNCGMRAFTKQAYEIMDLQTTGMEFISEMVIKASLWNLRVAQVPIVLHPDGRSRPPHLKPWRDGWRNLRFMLIYSPRWLFLIPGIILAIFGFFGMVALYFGPIIIKNIVLDSGAMIVVAMAAILGTQLVIFAISTKVFAMGAGLVPEDKKLNHFFNYFTLEKGLLLGSLLMGLGFAFIIHALLGWKAAHFGNLSYSENMRNLVPGTTLSILGAQLIFTSFFVSVLGLRTVKTSGLSKNKITSLR